MELKGQNFIQRILDAGGEVYLVGGHVRDRLLQIAHKDYDVLVRGLEYVELIHLLKPFGWAGEVGRSFGIVKFRPRDNADLEIDFSLPRVERSVGAGHRDFEVFFDKKITVERDLARRDFTINAMALNIESGKMIDPFGGQTDLRNRVLRQVFKEAFVEDPLRLMRAVQFAARFKLTIEEETQTSMKDNAHLIKSVSPERITFEIQKLLKAPQPSVGFDIMRDTGILKILFPFMIDMIGVKQPKKKNEDVYQHTMKVVDAARSSHEMEHAGDLNLMLAALFHDTGKPFTVGFDAEKNRVTFYGHQNVSRRIAKRWLKDFRAQTVGADPEKIVNLVSNHMFETKAFYSERAIRRFISKVGPNDIFDLIDLRIADKKGGRYPESMRGILNLRSRIRQELDKKPPFGPRDLAVNGHDIMALGFRAGPIVGEIQRFLVQKTLDDPRLNRKESLLELIEENFPLSQKKTIVACNDRPPAV